jgi:hypothetical protein
MKLRGRLEPTEILRFEMIDQTFSLAEKFLEDLEAARVYLYSQIVALKNKTLLKCLKSKEPRSVVRTRPEIPTKDRTNASGNVEHFKQRVLFQATKRNKHILLRPETPEA